MGLFIWRRVFVIFFCGMAVAGFITMLLRNPRLYNLKRSVNKRTATKGAICFGLNYSKAKAKFRLFGCINDANAMARLIHDVFDMPRSIVVTDAKQRMRKESFKTHITRLARQSHTATPDDKALFVVTYAGHGTQLKKVEPRSEDESDGKDECFVMNEKNEVLSDDEFSYLLSLFSENTKILLMIDCCHSATICDLQFKYTHKSNVSDPSLVLVRQRYKIKADVVAFAACADHQFSREAVVGGRKRGFFSLRMDSCIRGFSIQTAYEPHGATVLSACSVAVLHKNIVKKFTMNAVQTIAVSTSNKKTYYEDGWLGDFIHESRRMNVK